VAGASGQFKKANRERQARAEDRRRAVAGLLKARVERSEVIRQVTEKFECHQSQVSRDISLLIERWKREAQASVEEWKARELAELDDMELKTIRGFDEARSSASSALQTVLSSLRGLAKEGFPEKPLKAVLSSIQAVVDDDAEAGALRALWIFRRLQVKEHRAKVLGLYAPTKVAPTTPDGKEAWDSIDLTDDDRARRIEALLAAARARADEQAAKPGREAGG
jgi:hypothetical protein